MICREVYGTETEEEGAVETAIRLPCGHDCGAGCIRTCLSPDKEARNTCPACRRTFFPAQPRPYLEHGLFDEDDDWHAARGLINPFPRFILLPRPNPAASFLSALHMVGQAGQPPREGQEVPQLGAREEEVRQRQRDWWGPHFFETTTEQYEESIRRARATIVTPQIPSPDVNMAFWSPLPYLQISASETLHPDEVDPQYLDTIVQAVATAYRTLPFREAVVYSILRNDGAHERLPPSSGNGYQVLTAEQEEALFRELERRGAFIGNDFIRVYTRLTHRQRWQVYREEDGYSWNPVTGFWSPDWWD